MHNDPAKCSATPSGDDIASRSPYSDRVMHGAVQLLGMRRHAPPKLAASLLVAQTFACSCYPEEADFETEHTIRPAKQPGDQTARRLRGGGLM